MRPVRNVKTSAWQNVTDTALTGGQSMVVFSKGSDPVDFDAHYDFSREKMI